MKIKQINAVHVVVGILLVGIAACTTPRKLIERGEYDRAIEKLVRSLQGKEHKSPKKVQLLERAFDKAQKRDLQQIRALKLANKEENWPRIYEIYSRIERRQELIEPLLPLVDKEGKAAHFQFVPIEREKLTAEEQAKNYLYSRAQELVELSLNTKNKSYARDAFHMLERLHREFGEYFNSRQLIDRARQLGTDYYFIRIVNRSNQILPESFFHTLTAPSGKFAPFWAEIDVVQREGKPYDYIIEFEVSSIDKTPDLQRERELEYESEIEEEGDGSSDTTTQKVRLRAKVLEVSRSKRMSLRGTVRILDYDTEEVLFTEPIHADYEFEERSIKLLEGDERAIPKSKRSYLNRHLPPFPSDEDFLYDAARHINSRFYTTLRRFERLK